MISKWFFTHYCLYRKILMHVSTLFFANYLFWFFASKKIHKQLRKMIIQQLNL